MSMTALLASMALDSKTPETENEVVKEALLAELNQAQIEVVKFSIPSATSSETTFDATSSFSGDEGNKDGEKDYSKRLEKEGPVLTSDEFLNTLGLKISDPNEKALIDSVRSFLDTDGKNFTLQFLEEHMKTFKGDGKELEPREQELYVKALFCDIYRNFKKGKYRLAVNGQKLSDNLSDEMSDDLFDKRQHDFEVYLVEFYALYQQLIADNKAVIADNKAAIAKGETIVAKNLKESEQIIKNRYQQYKDQMHTDEILQNGIKIKNVARDLQKNA
jgi:hypothetical protein